MCERIQDGNGLDGCPLCGGAAAFVAECASTGWNEISEFQAEWKEIEAGDIPFYGVFCTGCYLKLPSTFDTLAEAREAWNRNADRKRNANGGRA